MFPPFLFGHKTGVRQTRERPRAQILVIFGLVLAWSNSTSSS